ncbi:MAG: c-type cytochrome [Fuerstiella sp.]|nr:c-type cytochrome [Fuerstiella sp.]MCP4509466.1 c-type cytochrome [Fuerstiella sp.]
MKRYFRLLIVILFTCCPRTATAIDETESLDLLVTTLNSVQDVGVRNALLRGMLSGLEGRRNVTAPAGWNELSRKLSDSEDKNIQELSAELSQIFGDREATAQALAMLTDATADKNAQRRSLRVLLTHQNEDASSLLESLLDDPALQLDAIRGYAMVENASAPAVLLGRYERWNAELKRAVIETLATRKRYAQALLAAVEQKTVSRDDIPAHVARSLKQLLGDPFVRVFGEVRPIAQDRQKLLARYKRIATPQKIADASASRGRAVFTKTCAACHVLYGEGGKIGPDLTGSNRANLDYILLNSVDPSYDVPAGYRMVTIVTVDGRVVSGVIAEEDETRIVLKTVEQPRLVIAKENIEERKTSPKSMMPDGQLEKMQRQELFDLIKYLRTTDQVEMAK